MADDTLTVERYEKAKRVLAAGSATPAQLAVCRAAVSAWESNNGTGIRGTETDSGEIVPERVGQFVEPPKPVLPAAPGGQ